MEELKYVMFDLEGLEFPILFPKFVNHNRTEEGMVHSIRRSFSDKGLTGGDAEVVSAGFWDGRNAHGMSESLKMNSRPQDTDIITKFLGK